MLRKKIRNLPLLWLKTTDLQTKHKCNLCKHDPVRMTENDREVICFFLPVVLTADRIYIAHLCSFARWLINEKKWKIADTTDDKCELQTSNTIEKINFKVNYRLTLTCRDTTNVT